jgi:SAM-dependent methyltransferase
MPDRRRARRGRARAAAQVVEAPTSLRVEPDPRRPGGRTLVVDEREASYLDLDDPSLLAWPYVRRIGDVIDAFRPPGTAIDAVHLGGGACTLARYVAATRPRSAQEVIEIDEGLVAFARAHLGLRTSPRLRVRVGDAVALLPRRPDRSVDLVVGDAFDGPDVPPALLTAPFAREFARVLRPRGVYVLNVVDAPPLPVARAAAGALRSAFASLAVVARARCCAAAGTATSCSSRPRARCPSPRCGPGRRPRPTARRSSTAPTRTPSPGASLSACVQSWWVSLSSQAPCRPASRWPATARPSGRTRGA